MIIEKIVVGPLMENAYVVGDEKSQQAVIIDPGDEAERIAERIEKLGLTVEKLICTHGHVDHVGAVEPLKRMFNARFFMHRDDEMFLEHTAEQGCLYGMPGLENPRIDKYLNDGDRLAVGESGRYTLEVMTTPGHSPGGVVLSCGGDIFVGDLIFAGSIGRTDLPGGDYEAIMASVEAVVQRFPGETRLHPGHGESTTLAVECRYNPFFQGLTKGVRRF